MELKELNNFRVIVELGSLSRAAVQLSIAQPALSRQIQKLERDLGVELIRRTPRGVSPTSAGKALLERTVGLERELEVIRRDVAHFAEQVVGTLNIAMVAPLAAMLAPIVVREYRRLCPDVALHVQQGYSGELIEGLINRTIDIAIVDAPTHLHNELHVSPLWVENLNLIGAGSDRGSPLFNGGPVSLSTVADLPMIIPNSRHAIRRVIDSAFSRRGLKVRPTLEVDGPPVIFELVKAGFGYALMPQCGYHEYVRAGDIVAVEIAPAIRRTISVVSRSELVTERIIAPMIEMIQREAPRIASSEQYGSATLYFGENAKARLPQTEEAAFSF